MTSRDTSAVEILSCLYTMDGTVRLRLSREIPIGFLDEDSERLALSGPGDEGTAVGRPVLVERDLEELITTEKGIF